MPAPVEHSAESPVYLDHNATTPVHPQVAEAMAPWFGPEWGNPSSHHAYGVRAKAAMAQARAEVAALLGVDAVEVIFTSSGTEADNMAVLCTGPLAPKTGRLVISAIEHPAVEAPAAFLENRGWSVERLGVDGGGRIDLAQAAEVLATPADIVSCILAQNETGLIQPVAELAKMARASNPDVVVHTDAAQGVAKLDVKPRELGVDLLTLVGHKMYAPKGIGALYVRAGVKVRPLLMGGGQEGGLRAGTESVPLIVGLGAAAALARADLAEEAKRECELREFFWGQLSDAVPGLVRTGDPTHVVPGTLHVCFPGCTGAMVLMMAGVVAASTGSACHSNDASPSGVLAAMGVAPELAKGAVRLSLGRHTTRAHVQAAAQALAQAWRSLQA